MAEVRGGRHVGRWANDQGLVRADYEKGSFQVDLMMGMMMG